MQRPAMTANIACIGDLTSRAAFFCAPLKLCVLDADANADTCAAELVLDDTLEVGGAVGRPARLPPPAVRTAESTGLVEFFEFW